MRVEPSGGERDLSVASEPLTPEAPVTRTFPDVTAGILVVCGLGAWGLRLLSCRGYSEGSGGSASYLS